jgi:hypothetical protein
MAGMVGRNFVESLLDLKRRLNDVEAWSKRDKVQFSNLIDWLIKKEEQKLETGQLYINF